MAQNETVEYDRLPMLVADLVRRQAARLASIAIGCRWRPSLYAPVLAFVTAMASYGHSRAGKTGCSHVN